MSETSRAKVSDPAELDEVLELALGRRAPYSQLGDWVLLAGASCEARTLYWGLSAHINVSRDDTEVWPGLVTLARILGLRKPENVSRYMLELEVLSAVEVRRSGSGLKRRNRYVVHQTPPPGFRGPQSMGDWYSANHGPRDESEKARKEREAQFDAWLAAVRQGLKEQCAVVAGQRAAAKKAKTPVPPIELFVAPDLEDFRTPAPRGTGRAGLSRKLAGRPVPPRQGVRTPAPGGLVPPRQGVEEDQREQHQSLSPPSATETSADAVPETREREKSASPEIPQQSGTSPREAPADRVVSAYEAAAGCRMVNGTRTVLRAQAVELLATGRSVEWLCARAAEMPENGWKDLIKHCEAQAVRRGGAADGKRRSSAADVAALRAKIAARGSGL